MPRISREARGSLKERLLRYYESLMVDAKDFVKQATQILKADNIHNKGNNDPDKKSSR